MKWKPSSSEDIYWYRHLSYLDSDEGIHAGGVLYVPKTCTTPDRQAVTRGWWSFKMNGHYYEGPFESEEAAKAVARMFCC